jgi:glycosyltransferase involved in cell wall biosynthesis
MRVTVLTTRLFDAPASGGELCTARLLAALQAAGHRVRLIGRGSAAGAVSLGPLVEAFGGQPLHRRAASLLGAWASGQASTVHRLGGGGAARQAALALLAAPMDALVVDHLQAWAWARPLRQRLPAPLLVLHNLEAAGYAEQADSARGLQRWVLLREARLLAALQADALRHAAAVACLSDGDAQALPAGPARRLQLPGYPLAGLRQHGPVAASAAGGGLLIGLIGTWTWAPNRAALQWMLAEVLPRLGPGARLLLAGTGLDRLPLHPAQQPRVQLLGRVADVADFYRRVDVVALPSLQGSGVQEKAIEAIAQARAVVATPHALRGLGPGLPGHVLQAASAADFAASCHGAVPSTPVQRLAVQHWARQRAALYQQQLQLGLLASAASRPLPALQPARR